ncbi:hypothetical protein TNCV_3137131 [Trichonephila clavipes]|nr:hypothetical protein TNCV_3137131 [Trichonephila clavipes]
MPIYSIKEVRGDFTDSLSNSGDIKVSSEISTFLIYQTGSNEIGRWDSANLGSFSGFRIGTTTEVFHALGKYLRLTNQLDSKDFSALLERLRKRTTLNFSTKYHFIKRLQLAKVKNLQVVKPPLAAIQAEIRRGIDSIRSLMTPVEDPAIVFASAQLILLYLGTAAVAFPARPRHALLAKDLHLAGHGRTSYP